MILDKAENHIIEGIRSGRESAYKLLFELYYSRLVVFAKKYLDDPEAARDIVQDLFLNLYESRNSINIQTSIKSYLYSSVKNRCLNKLRHEKVMQDHRNRIGRTDEALDRDLEEMIDATDLEARIFGIVSRLPEQCRRIYTLSRGEGKRNKEIADELNLSVRTVETQISKALRVLRDNLLPLSK